MVFLSSTVIVVLNLEKMLVFNSITCFSNKKACMEKAIQDNDSYVLQENDADEFTNQSIRSQILPGIALGNDVESREGSFTVQNFG